MKNNFAEEYAREQEIRAQYNTARDNKDEDGMEKARNAHQEFTAEMETKGEEYSHIYNFYTNAKDRGNDYIDLHDCIFEKDVPNLIERLRKYGIEKFTFSSTWSSAVEIAWLFTQNGCTLEGLIEINSNSRKMLSGEFEKCHGYLFGIH